MKVRLGRLVRQATSYSARLPREYSRTYIAEAGRPLSLQLRESNHSFMNVIL
jgi:hypothetical protein